MRGTREGAAVPAMDEASAEELQAVVQELQLVSQQTQQVQAQQRELTTTLETLAGQPEDRPVYRQQGPLLLEIEDRDALRTELDEGRSRLHDLELRLSQRETELRARYESLAAALEAA